LIKKKNGFIVKKLKNVSNKKVTAFEKEENKGEPDRRVTGERGEWEKE
jgi:hypothetical protein